MPLDARNSKRFREVLRGGKWFSGLSADFQDALLGAGVARALGKGEWLFARGQAHDGLYAMIDGSLRVFATAPNGKEAVLTLVEPPMWFGEISVIDGQPRTHDGVAAEASLVMHVPQAALDAILGEKPERWRDLAQLVTAKLRMMFTLVEDNAVLPTSVRLARRLVMAAARYGEWEGKSSKVIDLKQEELATMLSTSRQTVNQVLKDLEGKGLVRLAYGNVEIVDLDGLRKAAGLG